MEVKVEKLPKSTARISVKVPSDAVNHTFEHVLSEMAENIEIPGFRKGKAPLDLIQKSVKEADLNGEVVNHLLKEYYVSAIKEHHLTPIGNPKVEIKKFAKDTDFEFEATFAERPEIKLGDYKSKIEEVKAGKEGEKEKGHLIVDDIISAVTDVSEIEISDLLIEDEVTRMLSRLLSQAETLGLTIEQYLSAQNKTAGELRGEYGKIAERNLKSEFALSKAIEREEIKVEEKEIEDAIKAVGDEKLRGELQKGADKWYIISVLAKNKLINKLLESFNGPTSSASGRTSRDKEVK